MPHNLTDVSTFTNPVPAPADGDNDAQASFDPAFQALANRTKFLKDVALGGIGTWPRVGMVQKISLITGQSNDVPTYWGCTGVPTTLQWVSDAAHAGSLVFPLDAHLRSGQTITQYDAIVHPANARTGGNKMTVKLYYIAHDITGATEPVAPTQIAVVTGSSSDDGTANKQRISVSGLSHVVDKDANEYFLRVTAGGATAGFDRVYMAQIVVTDPGPRSL